jgi:hypothetical protein
MGDFKLGKPGNDLVLEHLRSKVENLIIESKSIIRLQHAGTKGEFRELLVKDYFQPLLTRGFSCGSGVIIDATNRQSPQTDLILYSKNFLPPILFNLDETKGIFPIESCFYVFEIKTKSTTEEISTTIKKFRKIMDMEILIENNCFQTKTIGNMIHRVLFAYDTDIVSDELERYRRLDPEANTNPAINVICIVNKGYYYFNDGQWNILPEDQTKNSLLWLTVGILNTLPLIERERGIPRFGYYLNGQI